MTLDNTITIAIAVIGIANVWILWRAQITQKTRETEQGSLWSAIRSLESDHIAFKLKVATEYVTQEGLRELEDRLVAAIERLGDRLDRVFEGRIK